MSRRNENLDKVLNEANDYYSLAGGSSGGATMADMPTALLSNGGAIDTRNFDVTAYAAEVLQHASIKDLYEKDTALRQEIRSLDGFLQDLVYKNYSKFINATDTIKKMRDNVVDIDAKLQALSSNVDDITSVSQTINKNLDSHRIKIQEMLIRNSTLQKIKFLVDLPASMEQSCREGRYSDAVAEWVKGDALLTAVLQRHSNVASFTRTQAECRKIARQVYDKLTNIIRNGGHIVPTSTVGSPSGGPTNNFEDSSKVTSKLSASSAQPPNTQSAPSPIDAEDAALLVQLAFSDLKALIPTSIFTDSTRPKNIESDVIGMQTEQVEATLKANIDVAVATVVSDLADAAIFDTSSNAYEHAGRKLASIGTDTINQTLKFSFAKYATSVQNMHGLVGGAGKNHNVLMETLDARVSATTKTSLVHIIDTIFPSLKTAAGALLKFIVVNQSKITDSHRAASDVSRIIQGVCEEAFEAITALLNSFSRGLKQLANKFLTSGEAAIGVMVDDAANSVLQFALATLSKFSEGAPTPPPTTESSTSSPPTSPTVTPSSGRAWILAHNVLVAALLSKKFVTYQVEGFGASGSSSSSALQGAFASATKKLIAHFVVLAGQHFSLLFQKEYLSLPDPTDIAGPHRAFQQVFGQWMSLHSECLMWFPDGQGKLTERIGHRHERSYSQGSASSSQQSFRPSQHAMSSAAGSGAGGRGQQQGIPPVATFNRQGNEVVGRLGGTSKRLAIIPTTIDARHIQEAVILYALLSLKDLVCIIHFTRPAFQQLQVDLSFILQQTSPNASYWLRDDDLFVSIVNDIATVAYSRTLGEKVPLTQGMVEKLARKDD